MRRLLSAHTQYGAYSTMLCRNGRHSEVVRYPIPPSVSHQSIPVWPGCARACRRGSRLAAAVPASPGGLLRLRCFEVFTCPWLAACFEVTFCSGELGSQSKNADTADLAGWQGSNECKSDEQEVDTEQQGIVLLIGCLFVFACNALPSISGLYLPVEERSSVIALLLHVSLLSCPHGISYNFPTLAARGRCQVACCD